MNKQSCCSASAMFSPPEKKGRSIIVEDDSMKPAFSVGEYVKVAGDTSPGMNRVVILVSLSMFVDMVQQHCLILGMIMHMTTGARTKIS